MWFASQKSRILIRVLLLYCRIKSLLNGTLVFNPDTVCTHHHHGEGHDCGSHSCGAHKNGCAGNH